MQRARADSERSVVVSERVAVAAYATATNGAGGDVFSIRGLSWLSADVLVALIRGQRQDDGFELIASIDGRQVDAESRWFQYHWADTAHAIVVASPAEADQVHESLPGAFPSRQRLVNERRRTKQVRG